MHCDRPHLVAMDLPLPDPKAVAEQSRAMSRRFRRAAWWSMCFVAALGWIKLFEIATGRSLDSLALRPHSIPGLIGVFTAPLLHGSIGHYGGNAFALMILGTLAGTLYPRATPRALPLIWIGSGVGAWFLGEAGTAHIGASGIAHGLFFLVFFLGLLRRDRQAIAACLLAFFLFGGMILTIFPREYGISWEMHLAGAIAGTLAALLWRGLDPALPRKRYSWEDEVEDDAGADPGAAGPPP